MSPPVSRGARRSPAAVALLLLLGTVFGLLTLRQMLTQELATDELTYAHGAWAISDGQVPYRDFFFHHTPLLLQTLAAVFLLVGDEPTGVLWLRVAMLVPFAAILWASYRLNRHLGEGWAGIAETRWTEAAIAPVVLLMVWPFVRVAVEIRPDNPAFALFLLALVALGPGPGSTSPASAGGRPGLRGLLAGFLVGAAVWASEKVLVYGSVFALGFAVDLVRGARGRGEDGVRRPGRYLLGHPGAFLAGFAVAALGAVTYLAATGSLDDFRRWGVEWSLLHERHYPGFSWRKHFAAFRHDYWCWFPVTLLGVAGTVREVLKAEARWSHRDLLLLASLVATLLSFTLQTAPMWYSLLPFLGVWAVFTARGVVWLLRLLSRMKDTSAYGRAARWALGGLVLLVLVSAGTAVLRLDDIRRNDSQMELLATLGRVTEPGDPVFDSTGTAVTRPHVSFFYFNDETARRLLWGELSRRIPERIHATGCTVAIRDARFIRQPEVVQNFVFRHFQPYDGLGSLWIWGRPFVPPDNGPLRDRFPAVRDGLYFVEPAEALAEGRLWIDGRRVESPVVELREGDREVVYEGESPVFRLLWLPRDGRTFRPDPRASGFRWPLRYRGLPGLGKVDLRLNEPDPPPGDP